MSRSSTKHLLLAATLMVALIPSVSTQAALIQRLTWDEGFGGFDGHRVDTTGEAILKFDQLSGTDQNLVSCVATWTLRGDVFEGGECERFSGGLFAEEDIHFLYTIDPSTEFLSVEAVGGWFAGISWGDSGSFVACYLHPGPYCELNFVGEAETVYSEPVIVPVQAVPAPLTWLLVATGLFGIGLGRKWFGRTRWRPDRLAK